jgi:transposase
MISMIDKQKIIQYWQVENKSEVAISTELGISRNTVRRYLKAFRRALQESRETGLPEPTLSEFLLTAPKYNTKNRGKRKLTGEIIEIIDGYLKENEEKRRSGKSKQVLKGIDIRELLQGSGHDIGYTVVCDYIRRSKLGNKEVFIRQDYQPGENCEFDWCDIRLTIGGVDRKLYMAVFTMCKSNYRFGMVFQRQDTLAFIEAHIAFFDHIGGVPMRMNYDNMRVTIAEFVGHNKKRPTVALMQLSTFYGFSFRFCNILSGHEKGHVERSVEYLRRKAFSRQDQFDTLALAQVHLDRTYDILNGKNLTGSNHTINELMSGERDMFLPYPDRMECFTLEETRVDKYSTFVFGNNHY